MTTSSDPIRVLDGHNDLPWHHREVAGYDLDACDIAQPQPHLHTDLPRMRAGGLAAQLWSVWVPCELQGEAAVAATHEQIDIPQQENARHARAHALTPRTQRALRVRIRIAHQHRARQLEHMHTHALSGPAHQHALSHAACALEQQVHVDAERLRTGR